MLLSSFALLGSLGPAVAGANQLTEMEALKGKDYGKPRMRSLLCDSVFSGDGGGGRLVIQILR